MDSTSAQFLNRLREYKLIQHVALINHGSNVAEVVVVSSLSDMCLANIIFENKPINLRLTGTVGRLVLDRLGFMEKVHFTRLNSIQELNAYRKTGVLKLTQIEEETIMEQRGSKKKVRTSTKVVITYTNGKSYTVKNVQSKVDVYSDKIIIDYETSKNVDGVILLGKIKANIPTKDVAKFVVFPVNRNYPDNEIIFKSGKVVKNNVTSFGEYQGGVGYVNF